MFAFSVIFALLATNLHDWASWCDSTGMVSPGRLTATVTHVLATATSVSAPHIREIGLSDETGFFCVRIRAEGTGDTLSVGDTIGLSETNETEWASYLNGGVTLIARQPPRPASAPDPNEILKGLYDYQVVRIQGRLRNIQVSEYNNLWTWIVLRCGRFNLYCATPSSDETFHRLNQLLDSEIALEGIVLPHDGSKRLHIGRVLHFAPDSIERIPRTSGDFTTADDLETIGNLPPSEIASLPQHRVRGQVLAVWDGNKALLRTGKGNICRVDFLSGTLPRVHTEIEALGYPECDLQGLNLSDARWRAAPVRANGSGGSVRVGDDPPVWQITLRKDYAYHLRHGGVIRTTGTVIALPIPEVNPHLLHLNCEGQILPINSGAAKNAYAGLEPGTRVEVTGICVSEIENYSSVCLFPRVTGCFLVLRTASDIRILSAPPWWTPVRTWSAIGLLLAALAGILVWNLSLRRMAARRSRELFREQLGHVKADLRTEERTRLAVELHDTLAQNLTGVSMEIEAANDLRGDAPPAMLDHLNIAAKALKSCRDELRNCLWDLRSQALEENDLDRAIVRTLKPHLGSARLAVRFRVPRARLSDNTTHALLRIIRELVVNAIRHGGASAIRIAGAIDGSELFCSVTDDGRGFDPESAPGVPQGHFGLQGVRERVAELNGTFDLASSPGRGARAVITILIPHED